MADRRLLRDQGTQSLYSRKNFSRSTLRTNSEISQELIDDDMSEKATSTADDLDISELRSLGIKNESDHQQETILREDLVLDYNYLLSILEQLKAIISEVNDSKEIQ